MKKLYTVFAILFGLLYTTSLFAQPASVTWALSSNTLQTSVSVGNVGGQSETISPGGPPSMVVFDYNSNGQRLWVGNTGWIAGPEDPLRYAQFDAAPALGNSLTVTNISFNYGDLQTTFNFNILKSNVYYSVDGWNTRTTLATGLVYLNTAMSSFNQNVGVPVSAGSTFSLRIYPVAVQNGIAATPTFAIHNTVVINGRTSPALGSICGKKFNDLNGNGVQDAGEPGLPNWQIGLNVGTIPPVMTDKAGNYCFINLPAGTYTISEVNQTGWLQTAPTYPGTYTVTLAAGQNIFDQNFGNQVDPCVNGMKAWSPLGTGTNGEVWALAAIGTDLYVGGAFTTAGGAAANHIAKWNGTSWSSLGNGLNNGLNGGVFTLAVIGSDLYAGGWFTSAGGSPAMNIAKWNGSTWSALGNGLPGSGAVEALAVMGNNLYAGGGFTTALGGPGDLIAKWDVTTSTWSAVGTNGGMDDRVNSLLVIGTDLYAGGQFSVAGGVSAKFIAKWNGTSWSALGSGMNLRVGGGLGLLGGNLYAGGVFTTAGNVPAARIAEWNVSTSVWSALGSSGGMNDEVQGFAVIGSDLYASGGFTTAAGGSENRVARWDGVVWSPLGTGMNDGVWRLAVIGTNLYAGGVFTTAGGVSANYVAKWGCTTALVSVDGDGTGNALPQRLLLKQNYPNPFNPTTQIAFELPSQEFVSLRVYNSLGQQVAVLVNEQRPAGAYSVTFRATDLPSGIYFYRLIAGEFQQTRKLLLLK